MLDRPLSEIGGKALWTKELDQWLGEGRIDASVHSAKDVETIRPEEFHFPAFLPRADRRDSLVGAASIAAIPHGAVVGTSAPRRAAQLLNLRPDCKVVTFRGNVATRLGKLDAGEADVTFLAAAGLERLGQSDVGHPLERDEWIPAAAQGVIAIECLAANPASHRADRRDRPRPHPRRAGSRTRAARRTGRHLPFADCRAVRGCGRRNLRCARRCSAPTAPSGSRLQRASRRAITHLCAALAADLLARATPGIAPHFRTPG